MRKNILLMLLLLAGLVAADSHRIYQGTLSPLERVSLELKDDHKFTFVLSDDTKLSQAYGTYAWKKNTLTLKVEGVEDQDGIDSATGFEVEIRRKGVDTPPPSVWFVPGEELRLDALSEGDSLILSGPEGWELRLFAKD